MTLAVQDSDYHSEFYLLFKKLFIWLHQALDAARGIFVPSCGISSCAAQLLGRVGAGLVALGQVGS